MKETICIIPARGGSKGIPKKNILPLAGKPMLAWSILQAKASKTLANNVYVSSDSDEILSVAESFGARAIQRPIEISGDTASSESAIIHAYQEISKTKQVDYIVFLQPTSPIRKMDDIENAIQKIKKTGADSLLSVQPLRDYFLWKQQGKSHMSLNFDYKNRKRRQELEVTYLENGSIYIFKPELLLQNNNRLGGNIEVYEMDKMHSVQVDEPAEFKLCEQILKTLYP